MEAFRYKECVLGLEKKSNFSRFDDFQEALVLFINKVLFFRDLSISIDRSGRLRMTTEAFLYVRSMELHLFNIWFPGGKEGERIISMLECFGTLRFTQCNFSLRKIKLSYPRVSFFECFFYSKYEILDMKLRKDKAYDDCLYQRCNFYDEVHCGGVERKEKVIISNSLFSSCNFFKLIRIKNVELNGFLFDGDHRYLTKMVRLKVENSVFHSGFYMNECSGIDYCLFFSCVFKGKFEFKNNSADVLFVDNCNFEKISDFYGLSACRLDVRKSIFTTFAGFEDCKLGEARSDGMLALKRKIEVRPASFVYVTFLEFASFRNSSFKSGLDVEKINTIQYPNFHGVKVASEGSNRETFRLIKHALDSYGSHVEANLFFAEEMRKYQEEGVGGYSDKFVYFVSRYSSNFGQNYLQSVILTILFSIVFYGLTIAQKNNYLYKIYQPANGLVGAVSDFFNGLAISYIPFKTFLWPGMEFLSLMFYMVFGVLFWQVIVSLKRLIKR